MRTTKMKHTNKITPALLCLLISAFGVFAQQRGLIAFTNVTVIPMDKERVLENQTVIIRNGLVIAIGQTGKIKVPTGTFKINGQGKYLLPGLWDMHAHLTLAGEEALKHYVMQGVTGVRDMGGNVEAVRITLKKPGVIAPRVIASGPVLESAGFLNRITKIEEILRQNGIEPLPAEIDGTRKSIGIMTAGETKKAFEALRKAKVDFVKARNFESREAYFAVAEEAKRSGLPFAGHSPTPLVTLEEASNAGQRSIEHLYFYEAALGKLSETNRKQLYAVFVKNDTWITPTIATEKFRTSADETVGPVLKGLFEKSSPESRFLTGNLQLLFQRDWKIRLLEHKIDQIPPSRDQLESYRKNIKFLREMHHARVKILAGTDCGALGMLPGYSLHDELKLFVEDIGMSPFEALRSATVLPAEYLGPADSFGTIKIGTKADLVLLEANPLKEIQNTRKIYGVVRDGKYYPKSELFK
jgi:imidazolonepropionase-like amidohydrolase